MRGMRELLAEKTRADEARRELLWSEARRAARVLRSLGAARVLVFGSLARDLAVADSDLDLLVVWDTVLPYWERTQAALTAIRPGVAMDLLVATPRELAAPTDFLKEILREGVEV